ncbi:MAG: hypothetical protein CSA97_00135 [Bacteroidetes bacterium]|nr:MAG: hypothetical protein CSA97_00135 [Bacteroidota bacterium]
MAQSGRKRVVIFYRLFLWGMVLLGAVPIVLRILWIQYVDGESLRSVGNSQSYKQKTIAPSRGNILADDKRLLVTSLPTYKVFMDMAPDGMTDELFAAHVDSLALCLSQLFRDKSEAAYRSDLISKRRAEKRYYRLGNRSLNFAELKRLRQFPLLRLNRNVGGLVVEDSYVRKRILGDLAMRTLGYRKGDLRVGLEGAFDDALRGTPGMRIEKKSYGGRYIPVGTAEQLDPVEGADVITTLDINLQDVVEKELRLQLEANQADFGTVVVMEVRTGDVKAIANLKRTESGKYREEMNYAVGRRTEPGSTFKVASLINLLEDGYVKLDDSVDTEGGKWRIHDKVIRDSHEGGYGKITVRRAWEVSSNVAVTKLVYRHYNGKEAEFVNRLYGMRLNQRLGLPIAGEAQPNIKYPDNPLWSGISLPMMSIGYEVELTPLQILTFYNAIANDGRMVAPRFVTELQRDGRTVETYPVRELVASICSPQTLEQVRSVLKGVVDSGTAKNLRAEKYKIAGKTGTAQIARNDKGYKLGGKVRYQASFAGYFPADAPQYSCIVVVSSPTKQSYYGNRVAGPIFRKIVDKVYGTRAEWFPKKEGSRRMAAQYCKRGLAEPLMESLDQLGVAVQDKSSGADWVTPIRGKEEVVVHSSGGSHSVGGLVVPNVQGMPLNDALFALENAGLRVRVRGRGSVKAQSVSPGTKLQAGTVVELTMSIL